MFKHGHYCLNTLIKAYELHQKLVLFFLYEDLTCSYMAGSPELSAS